MSIRKPSVLITGASGEIGHGLISSLSGAGDRPILTLDLNPLAVDMQAKVRTHFVGSILDSNLLDRILAEYEIELIFHLAALLSTRSEFAPGAAHKVNVEGTLAMLQFAQDQGESHGRTVTFLYPSSIAAYGLPDLETKMRAGKVHEDEHNNPTTIYGCNKLYCEQLGRYYSKHYRQLAVESSPAKVDFRSLRFPGLISAHTIPSGGTSDFAPEMIHAAAQKIPYPCFVRPDTRIPFMAMPDAVEALLKLASADRYRLSRTVYNVAAFHPSAGEVQAEVERQFPGAEISSRVDPRRQSIVDSWPADVDDSAAREDWGFSPRYDFATAFEQYLEPAIRRRYAE